MTAKDNMKATNVENVDKVLDEINETTDQMKQIQEAFAQPTGLAGDMDEDELLGELEELEATELDKELLQPAPVPVSKVGAVGWCMGEAVAAAAQWGCNSRAGVGGGAWC